MNSKGQAGIIISILILLIVFVGMGYAFYYVWTSSSLENNSSIDNNITEEPQQIAYTVTNIINPDTIQANGQTIKLLCTKAPKVNEPYYNESLQYVKDLLLDKQIILKNDTITLGDIDGNGIVYRYVWLDDILVNQNLVRLGYAKSDPSYSISSSCQAIIQSEIIAQTSQLGIWQ